MLAALACSRRAAASDGERARQLFEQGRKLLEGNELQACQLFRESLKLDPRVGTQLNVANCEEQEGHLLAAHQYWIDAAEAARASGDARADYAASRATAIAERLPKLTVRLGTGAPGDAIVSLDGIAFSSKEMRAMPVEPGEHLLVATARNWDESRLRVTLAEHQASDITIELGRPVSLAPSTAGPGQSEIAARSSPDATRGQRSGDGWMRPTGYALSALGAASAAVGTYFGVEAMAKKNASDAGGQCSGSVCTTYEGLHQRSDSAVSAAFSTAAFVGAGVAAAGAVVLFVLAPRGQRAGGSGSVGIVAGPSGASLCGKF